MTDTTRTKDPVRYCIGCKHLEFDAGSPGYDTECTSGIGAEDASMGCKKGHWQQYLYSGAVGMDFERAMESAATCRDYQERDK